MSNNILQININHSRDGHDMMLQRMAEGDFALAVVSEPYMIPQNNPMWYTNENKTVAITWRKTRHPLVCVPIGRGKHHVTVKWGDTMVIGTYLSPNISFSEVERATEEMERSVWCHHDSPILIGGDFNAKAVLWESPNNECKRHVRC